MSVCDGATVRKERILDLLQYCRGFMPNGATIPQVQLYMSLGHGLTSRKTLEYLMEMQQGGVLNIQQNRILIKLENFKRLIEILAPERDPDTGQKRQDDLNGVFEDLRTKEKRPSRGGGKGASNKPDNTKVV